MALLASALYHLISLLVGADRLKAKVELGCSPSLLPLCIELLYHRLQANLGCTEE